MAANTAEGAKKSGASDEDLSMEEILQSIRRIIAEDDTDAKKVTPISVNSADNDILELTEMVAEDGSVLELKDEKPAEAVAEKPVEKPAEPIKTIPADVLNTIDQALTPEKLAEMPPEPKPIEQAAAPQPAKAVSAQDDIDAMFAAPAPAPAPAPASAPAAPAAAPAAAAKPAPVETADSLLSTAASSAAASSIQKLKSAEPEPPPLVTTPSPHFQSGNSVEGMVADMLRPMMKSWLDANLPQIVERIVEREVKKLTKYLTDPGE